MASYSEEEQFFDSLEEISPVSDWDLDCSDCCAAGFDSDNTVSCSSHYNVWIDNLESVHDRRSRFLKWMGLSLDRNSDVREEFGGGSYENVQLGINRMLYNSGAELRTSYTEDVLSSSRSSMSFESCEALRSSENGLPEEGCDYKIKNLDNGTVFVVDEVSQDGMISRLHEVGSNQSLSFEDFQRNIGTSPLIQRLLSRYVDEARDMVKASKKAKGGLLKRLTSAVRNIDRHGNAALNSKNNEANVDTSMQRIKVHQSKKRFKELSSLHAGQEFLAHNGSILTMKFSLDGQYLATGGEDGVVRVWKVIEDSKSDHFEVLASDPSCLYYTMNHHSEVGVLGLDKNKVDKTKRNISSNSTCVILPPKTFRVSEKPLHEFQGHCGEVLDLSWSEKRFILSSSADNTVRLWQVGCDRCLRVFPHNNYVTCVDFNPVDDNYFISGSIDGKVRIWEVLGCQVVDYTDVKDIVTAVCYRPSGKGGIVGSMAGKCFFYDIIDNQLQLDAQICLQGKKKLTGKRIIRFEFSPSDPSKVVVTSADSLVRVLCGMDVIYKFRASGLRVASNQMFASFTSDAKHIVSTGEDSSIYVWNYNSQERASRVKNVRSCESFPSKNASIAIPWRGIESTRGSFISNASGGNTPGSTSENDNNRIRCSGAEADQKMPNSSPDFFSRTRGFLLDSLTRGSATWPEEKLPNSSPIPTSPTKWKSEFKFLKNACQNMLSSSHMWGLVIVTAGWDGRIRTYLNYGLPLRI